MELILNQIISNNTKTFTNSLIKFFLEDNILNIQSSEVLTISSFAFLNNMLLQEINFPQCTIIGPNAFKSCTSLQYINFSKCIEIGFDAFYKCISLQSVNFPQCITIGSSAFLGCTSLQEASFSSCNRIYSSAFYSCHSLSALYLLASSVCTLLNINAFRNTPITNSTYLGYYGSVYVPASLVNSYKAGTTWVDLADRIVAYQE